MPTRKQFLQELRKMGRKNGFSVKIITRKGKGSHVEIWAGRRHTIVKDGELSPKYITLVKKQLGL